jgi:PRTRC genetic system protein A
MTLDPRDAVLQGHVPAVMVPRFGTLDHLASDGHRFLVAYDGLWLEVRRRWLHLRALVAPVAVDGIAVPYGRISDQLAAGRREYEATYAWAPEEMERLQTIFVHDARNALPDEFAAWGVWNTETGRLEYRPLFATEASPDSIDFSRPKLEPHEHLAVDLHSHGKDRAFFSSTDDEDDAGEVKLAVVAGQLNKQPTFVSRLCALGMFIDGSSEQITRYAQEIET